MSTMPMGGYADYDLENQQLERRRKMAEMLSMNAQKPYAAGSMVGNVYVPTHWTQHAAQALNGYASDKEMERLDAKQMDVARRKQDDMRTEGAKFAELLRGKPATEQTHTADDQLAYGGTDADSVSTQVHTPAVPGDRAAAMAFALGAKNPMLQQAGMAEMLKTPESQFGKLNPKDYTPESLRRFAATGGKDFSVLETRKNLHFADVGGQIVGVNPETGVQAMPGMQKGMTPDALANLQQKQYQFNNLSAADRQRLEMEAQRVGMSAMELFFNTGMQAPVPAPLPANAPAPAISGQPAINAPRMQIPSNVQAARDSDRVRILQDELAKNPNDAALQAELRNAQSGRNYAGLGAGQSQVGLPPAMNPAVTQLTPKGQAAIAQEKAGMEAKRDFNMSGLGSTIDEARTIFTGKNKPTNSYVGAGVDVLGQVVGLNSKGAEQADKLKAISGVLVTKMPRMEGPQSDKDVQLYREMAGQIGDNTMPINRRLAALDMVEQLWRKYDKSSPLPTGASGSWGEPPAGAVRRKQ